jgi:hypothetical protein
MFARKRKKKQRELAGAVAYLETLLREAAVSGEWVSSGRSEGVPRALVAPGAGAGLPAAPRPGLSESLNVTVKRFIETQPVLREYVQSASEEDRTDPRRVLVLAKADLERCRAFRSVQVDSNATSIRSLVLTAVGGIVIAAFTSWLNTRQEIEAHRAAEVYSGRRQFLQETIGGLGEARETARVLYNDLRHAEAGGGLQAEDVGSYRFRLEDLRRKLGRVLAGLQAARLTELRFAELRAFYEVEALDVCLEKAQGKSDGSERLRQWIEDTRDKELSSDQVQQLLVEASTDGPCGKMFNSGAVDDLIHSVAGVLWSLADSEEK